MRKTLFIISLLLIACAVSAQENPTPLPPDYQRIEKEIGRCFGEYRYSRLEKRFLRCDTTMTVDHFRCLYYGAALRGDSTYTLMSCGRQYHRLTDSLGQWHPATQQAWWRFQMLTSAVWSSGNGSEEYPFYVSCRDDERCMNYECKGFMDKPFIVVYPHEYNPSLKEIQRRLLSEQDLLPSEQQADLFRQMDERWWGDESDSLLMLLLQTYDSPKKQIWAEIQLAQHNLWQVDCLRAAIGRHRDDTSALMADLYHLLAADYYWEASEHDCGKCFEAALRVCDSAILLWPRSDGAERCRYLAERIRLPEVLMADDHRQDIHPFPASEWAITSLWHRNAKRVYIKVYALDDTTFLNPLYEWDMCVTRHNDPQWHEAYLYLPPMPEGRYLLRASTDRKFSTWSEIELVRSDLVLYSDTHGHGYVLNFITGEPVEGFPVEVTTLAFDRRTPDSILATTLTDSLGMFDFSHLLLDEHVSIRALHASIDLGRSARFHSEDKEVAEWEYCNLSIGATPLTVTRGELKNLHAGDTVHFQCILFTREGPLPNVPQKIFLETWGNEKFDSLDIVTNEHGIGQGFFVLPKDSVEYLIYNDRHFFGLAQASTEPEPDESHINEYTPSYSDTNYHAYPFYVFEDGTQNWDSLCYHCAVNSACKKAGIDVGITVERLKVPQEHRLTPSAAGKETEHSLSEREFRRRYPLFTYDWRHNNPDTWEADTLAFSDHRHFPSSPSIFPAFALPPLPEGVYRTTLTLHSPLREDTYTYHTTLYSVRKPFVTNPFNAWIDTSAHLQVGDTLYLHLETWLPDQQAVISVGFNHLPLHSQRIHLSSDTLLLAIPIEEEGIVTIHIATACHGEMMTGNIHWYVGEFGKKIWDGIWNDVGDGRTADVLAPELLLPVWREFRHKIHRQSLDYPLRKHPMPNIWDYLGIGPHTGLIHIYDPYGYRLWRTFSHSLRLPSNKK